MLSSPSQPAASIRPKWRWRNTSVAEAAGLIQPGSTVAVGWLSDGLASALVDAFTVSAQPDSLTIVYGATTGDSRNHGLNLLAHEGLVRRVVGGQWHPVLRLQALSAANRIEAYSFPVGVIRRLFHDIADGLPGHLTRSGLGTSSDPRNGGGRLNRRTWEQLVRLVYPGGENALLFEAFPIDAALVEAAFMADTGSIAMTRDSMTIAQAARKSGGIVIAQTNRVGTLAKLPSGHVVVPDTLIDILVTAEPHDRTWETFSPASGLLDTPATAALGLPRQFGRARQPSLLGPGPARHR